MPVFTSTIPKLVTLTSVDFEITNGNPVLTTEGTANLASYNKTVAIDLPVFTFTGTYGVVTTVVTVASLEVLRKIEVGDTITIAGGDASGSTLAVSTTVASIDETALTFTLSAEPTSTGTGTVTFSCDPVSKTVQIYQLKEKVSISGNRLKVEILYTTQDKVTPTEIKLGEFFVNVEQFLTLQGVSKTNDNTLII